jgi:hypothetical protein
VPIVHLGLYVADIGRLNSTTELQGCGMSVRLLFNAQHWQLTLYQLVIGCWIRKPAFLRYPGMHDECHLQAIEEKRGILILDDVFRQMARIQPVAWLAQPGTGLLIDARGRNVRRTGGFREGERHHVARGAAEV